MTDIFDPLRDLLLFSISSTFGSIFCPILFILFTDILYLPLFYISSTFGSIFFPIRPLTFNIVHFREGCLLRIPYSTVSPFPPVLSYLNDPRPTYRKRKKKKKKASSYTCDHHRPSISFTFRSIICLHFRFHILSDIIDPFDRPLTPISVFQYRLLFVQYF